MKIIVTNRSEVPIYEQVKKQIKEAIFTGELTAGDVLPSFRNLARDLQISIVTVNRAYNDLAEEGFVTNVQGKGCYVQPQNRALAREHAMHKIEVELTKAVTAAKASRITKAEIIEVLNILCEVEGHE